MVEVSDRKGRGVLFVLIVVVMLVPWATTGTAAAQSAPDCSTVEYSGDGTEANPYEVSNVDQLQCIENQDLNANYVQVSDIDASGTSEWNNGKGFNSIGTDSDMRTAFTGTFDGVGHTISGLYINRGSTNSVGLFGYVDSAGRVEYVGLKTVDITGNEDVGGLVGENRGNVTESYATGDVSGSGDAVGGLVGTNIGTVRKSYANGSVNGSSDVGGLVGGNGGTVNESYATGDVSGSGNTVGGLIGFNRDGGIVTASYATGNVSGNGDVGGLVGTNGGISSPGTVTESYATGDVSGDGGLGGLVGFNRGGGTVTASYATGNVSGFQELGGLIGSNRGEVNESYATGNVSGNGFVGGLVGQNDEGTITESYWDVQSTGRSTPAGNGTGLATSGMTGSAALNNMQGFDFRSTWETVPGDYPILAWQTDGDWGTNASGSDSNSNGGGGEASDGESDGNSGGDGGNTSANSTESEGLPGFTVVTAALALLTVFAVGVRRRTK
jgi:hypothetical protein